MSHQLKTTVLFTPQLTGYITLRNIIYISNGEIKYGNEITELSQTELKNTVNP